MALRANNVYHCLKKAGRSNVEILLDLRHSIIVWNLWAQMAAMKGNVIRGFQSIEEPTELIDVHSKLKLRIGGLYAEVFNAVERNHFGDADDAGVQKLCENAQVLFDDIGSFCSDICNVWTKSLTKNGTRNSVADFSNKPSSMVSARNIEEDVLSLQCKVAALKKDLSDEISKRETLGRNVELRITELEKATKNRFTLQSQLASQESEIKSLRSENEDLRRKLNESEASKLQAAEVENVTSSKVTALEEALSAEKTKCESLKRNTELQITELERTTKIRSTLETQLIFLQSEVKSLRNRNAQLGTKLTEPRENRFLRGMTSDSHGVQMEDIASFEECSMSLKVVIGQQALELGSLKSAKVRLERDVANIAEENEKLKHRLALVEQEALRIKEQSEDARLLLKNQIDALEESLNTKKIVTKNLKSGFDEKKEEPSDTQEKFDDMKRHFRTEIGDLIEKLCSLKDEFEDLKSDLFDIDETGSEAESI